MKSSQKHKKKKVFVKQRHNILCTYMGKDNEIISLNKKCQLVSPKSLPNSTHLKICIYLPAFSVPHDKTFNVILPKNRKINATRILITLRENNNNYNNIEIWPH